MNFMVPKQMEIKVKITVNIVTKIGKFTGDMTMEEMIDFLCAKNCRKMQVWMKNPL